MRVKVNATVYVPQQISEIVEVNDAEYEAWRDGEEHDPGLLIEFFRCGVGLEFRNRLMIDAINEFDESRITKVEVLP